MSSITDLRMSISGIRPNKNEKLFDKSDIVSGIHLRWNFDAQLGFPPGGFLIQRYAEIKVDRVIPPDDQEASYKEWHIKLPKDVPEALSRLKPPELSTELRNRFEHSAEDIINLLTELDEKRDTVHPYNVYLEEESGDAFTGTIRTIDALLISSVDPYIARMLGLYLIDQDIDKRDYRYVISGLWGESNYPIIELSMPNQSFGATEYPVTIDKIEFSPGAGTTLRFLHRNRSGNEFHDQYLSIGGEGSSKKITLSFESVVEEIWITTRGEFDFQNSAVYFRGESVTTEQNSHEYYINAQNMGCKNLEIVNLPINEIYIERIAIREQKGQIGILKNQCVINSTYSDKVPAPTITDLKQKAMPAILGDDGKVKNKISEVEISALVHMPQLGGIFNIDQQLDLLSIHNSTFANKPVRIQFSKKGISEENTFGNTFKYFSEPVFYRDHLDTIALPELLGYWPLDGQYRNLKTGKQLTVVGNPVVRRNSSNDSYATRFNGEDRLVGSGQKQLSALGGMFTVQVGINISTHCLDDAIILESNKSDGFSWRLRKNAEKYNFEFWLKGASFVDPTPLPPNLAITATFLANKTRLMCFIHSGEMLTKTLDISTEGFYLEQLDSVMSICGSGDGDGNFYQGELTKLSIWQKCIHPVELETQLRKHLPYLQQQESIADLVYCDTQNYNLKVSEKRIVFTKTPAIQALSTELSIFMWIRPSRGNGDILTLLGNNEESSFRIGLVRAGTSNEYQLDIWIAGENAQSSIPIVVEKWVHVGFSFLKGKVVIFINGITDDNVTTLRIKSLPNQNLPIAIGSENRYQNTLQRKGVQIDNGVKEKAYEGLINDIQFWRQAINYHQWQSRTGAVQTVHRMVENEKTPYRAQAIDLFGRVSAYSTEKLIKTNAKPIYNSPVNLRTQFLPIIGRIVSVSDVTVAIEEAGTVVDRKKGYHIITDIEYNTAVANKLRRYDIKVSRYTQVPRLINGAIEYVDEWLEQSYEIDKVSVTQSDGNRNLALEVNLASFEQLNPSIKDNITIDFDYMCRLDFAWTGIQQVYNQEVSKFNVLFHGGIRNEISEPIEVLEKDPSDANDRNIFKIRLRLEVALRTNAFQDFGLDNKFYCLISGHRFEVLSNTSGRNPTLRIKYNSEPLIEPTNGELLNLLIPEGHPLHTNFSKSENWSAGSIAGIEINPETMKPIEIKPPTLLGSAPNYTISLMADSEREALIAKNIDWLPESDCYKISIANSLNQNAYKQGDPKDYIPAAVVFFDESEPNGRWRCFYVVWHERTDEGIVIYTLPGEKNEVLPQLKISDSQPVKLYIGKQITHLFQLPDVPDFSDSKSTLQYHVAVQSEDDSGYTSALSINATAVAVNRQNPLPAPKPNAQILTQADYYGKAEVEVTWEGPSGGGNEWFYYKLFRATDGDIYTRDLEQRRSRMGFYKAFSDAELLTIFSDDPDFSDWLQTQDGVSLNDLFPNSDPDSDRWLEITPIWRKWADRFYPALNEQEVQALGERQGNEVAFKLLTGKPLKATKYNDEINGLVRNRYFYRLKTISQSLAETKTWGRLSDSIVPIAIKPPRKPVFTKIEAGDREVRLEWSLNRELDFKEYVLYRSERKEDLDDLRWWKADSDPRIVAIIPDPRILSKDNQVELPGDIEIDEVLGVYRVDEFDENADPIEQQNNAFNYFDDSRADSFTSVESENRKYYIYLKKIASRVSLVVVITVNGSSKKLIQTHATYPYIDQNTLGAKNYFYKLRAKSTYSYFSDASEVVSARAINNFPPSPPVITTERVAGDVDDIIRLTVDHLSEPIQLALSVVDQESGDWVFTKSWSDANIGDIIEFSVSPNAPAQAELHYRTPHMNYGQSNIIIFEPVREGLDE